jgi:hypothetical protein
MPAGGTNDGWPLPQDPSPVPHDQLSVVSNKPCCWFFERRLGIMISKPYGYLPIARISMVQMNLTVTTKV